MTDAGAWARDALGYRFRNEALLDQALTHRSADGRHNERLEFLGDAVLGLVVSQVLYEDHRHADEGSLSRLRARLVRRETLEDLGRELQFGHHLRLGSGEVRFGGQPRPSILANGVEAAIGAVFLDGGWTAAEGVVRRLLAPRIAGLIAGTDVRDPKTRLQEWLQGSGHPLPVYEVQQVRGEPHAQQFSVICRLTEPGLTVPGEGTSRRGAEQEAAARALRQLGIDG